MEKQNEEEEHHIDKKQNEEEEHHIDKKQKEEEEHHIDKKQNEEEHHIDKKQKTKEHQQDADAVKAPKRRVKKLSHKGDLDPSMGVGYYLNFGISPGEIPPVLPACPGRFPHLAKDDVETRLILTKRQYRKMVEERMRSNMLFF